MFSTARPAGKTSSARKETMPRLSACWNRPTKGCPSASCPTASCRPTVSTELAEVWHLVLWPKEDDELSEFLRLLTVTHTQRWHAHYHSAGTGPVYQGRFKSFPIQQDEHLLTVCRYVERNTVRAGLLERAEHWEWCSPARRRRGAEPAPWLLELKQWPVDVPRDWRAWVNRAETAAELEALRKSVKRSSPYGAVTWQRRTAGRLGLESTLRPRGRPRVRSIKDSRPL